ncbi:hypothetical protein T492DRAFT_980486 [Pavlovales sp. CCMP2436]|nr:hypothetical protein T492DRAFT_980486 [Pavlovales sp. CCMP2436]
MLALLLPALLSLVSPNGGRSSVLAGSTRRGFAVAVPFAASAALCLPSVSYAAAGATYNDEATGVSFAYPSDWSLQKTTIARSQLPIVIVTKNGAPSTNAFFSVNSIRGDYASLGSFGTPADVLVTLVPPPGTPGITSEVISSAKKGTTYEFDYKLSFDTGVTRHLRTTYGITHSPAGYDYLVTLTAQSLEQDYASAKAELDAVLGSVKGL